MARKQGSKGTGRGTGGGKTPEFDKPDDTTQGTTDEERADQTQQPSDEQGAQGTGGDGQSQPGEVDNQTKPDGPEADAARKDSVDRPPFGGVVEIGIPLVDPDAVGDKPRNGYQSRRRKLEVGFTVYNDENHIRQYRAMRHMHSGLMETAARLANGKRVQSMGDAVRWMLERVADEIELNDKANTDGQEEGNE